MCKEEKKKVRICASCHLCASRLGSVEPGTEQGWGPLLWGLLVLAACLCQHPGGSGEDLLFGCSLGLSSF